MNLALFDFDGTITSRELFVDFVHYATPRWRLALGKLALAPMIVGYKLGWVSLSRLRAAVVAVAFRGTDEAHVRKLGKGFCLDVIGGALRANAMECILWHKRNGDRVVVVSGALDVYLEHWCAEHSLELICSGLESRLGRLTGRYRGRQCVGEEKAARVRAHLQLAKYSEIYAYGDTREDFALLALANRKFFRWKEC